MKAIPTSPPSPSPKRVRWAPPSPATCHPRSTGRPPKDSWPRHREPSLKVTWRHRKKHEQYHLYEYMNRIEYVCGVWYIYIYDVWLYVYMIYMFILHMCVRLSASDTVYHCVRHDNVWYVVIAIIKKHQSSHVKKNRTGFLSDINIINYIPIITHLPWFHHRCWCFLLGLAEIFMTRWETTTWAQIMNAWE